MIFIFISFTFYMSYTTQSVYLQSKNVDFTKTSPRECEFNTVTLPRVSNACCKMRNGEITGNRLQQIDGYDVQINPTPTFYKTVCSSICPNGVGKSGICIDAKGNIDKSNNPEYQKCVTRLEPKGCKWSANPVARENNTIYYAKRYGTVDCDETEPCQ